MKRDLAGAGGEDESEGERGGENESEGWGVEMVGADGSETGLVTKNGKKMDDIGDSLTPDFRDKEESNKYN